MCHTWRPNPSASSAQVSGVCPYEEPPAGGRMGRDGCVVYNTQLGGSPKEHPRKHALRFPST